MSEEIKTEQQYPVYPVSQGQKYWTIVQPDIGNGWYSIVYVHVDKALDDADNFWDCSLVRSTKPRLLSLGSYTERLDDRYTAMHYGKVWPRAICSEMLFGSVEDAINYIILRYLRVVEYLERDLKNGMFKDTTEDGCVLVCPVHLDRLENPKSL